MIVSEIRIGNLIAYTESEYWQSSFRGTTVEVGIDEFILIEDEETDMYGDEIYAPILLTEEWFIEFGFEKKINKVGIFEKSRLRICLGLGGCLCYLIDEDNSNGYYISNGGIKYVHQLQNLFHALTGEELT